MINTDGWSAMKKLKHSLLRRAFDQNRGPEVILLIQWRAAAVRHAAEKDVETLKNFEQRNAGQPRAIRALNLIEEQNGNNVVYKLTEEQPEPRKMGTKEFFRMLADMPMEKRILYVERPVGMPDELARIPLQKQIVHADPARDFLARCPVFNADGYDPMEGIAAHEDPDYFEGKIERGLKTAYDMACADEAKFNRAHGIVPDVPPPSPPSFKLH